MKEKYQIINTADSFLYVKKDTSLYIKEMNKLKKKQRLFDEELMLMNIYLSIGDSLKAKKHALRSFSLGGTIDILPAKFNSNYFTELKKKHKIHYSKFLRNKQVIIPFLHGIYELLGSDQLIRNMEIDSTVNKYQRLKVDSANLHVLMGLIDTYGFPKLKDYGSEFHRFYILMIHLPYLDEKIYQRFLNFYKENLQNGAITPDLLAYFIDRHDYSSEGQTYGTLADPYFGVAKIKDELNVENRRKELFLSSMKIWLAKRGIKE